MERIRRLFRPPGSIRIYTAEVAESFRDTNDRERLQDNIIGVDFSKTPSFADPNRAETCVVVLTSQGSKGSLSHLRAGRSIDTKVLGRKLLRFHGYPAPVCLAGGIRDLSEDLVTSLTRDLSDFGFYVSPVLPHADLGGEVLSRRVTLFQDKVEVERVYPKGAGGFRILTFPR